MFPDFSTRKITFTDKSSLDGSGTKIPGKVAITLKDAEGTDIKSVELEHIPAESIYKLFDANENIILDDCYIENFSFSEYRKSRNLRKNQVVHVNGFIARNSFFDHETEIDFSHINFQKGDIDFGNSVFYCKILNFESSTFGNNNVSFDGVRFLTENFNFNAVSFGKGCLSFRNSIFRSGLINFSHLNFKDGEICFEKADFGDGNIDFNSILLGNVKLDFIHSSFGEGQKIFDNADLGNGDIIFVSSNFHSCRVTFKSTLFREGKVDFRFANFNQSDLIFDRAIFNKGVIDFGAIEFTKGRISFNRSEFENNKLIFEGSELFDGQVIFRKNEFVKGDLNFESIDYNNTKIIFDNVNFREVTASFYKSKIYSLTLKSCQINALFNLQVNRCQNLDLSYTVIRDVINLISSEFPSNIEALDLTGVLLLGKIYLDWEGNKVKSLINNQKTSTKSKYEQFRILKENYHSLGHYDAEDEAYVAFKRLQEKAYLEDAFKEKSLVRKILVSISYGFKWLIFDKVGLYATNPLRVLLSMLVANLFFVLVFLLLPLISNAEIIPSFEHQTELTILGKALYHSVITFLTIGYGDYYPSGILSWISGIEGFIGLFLISYFTVAFVRKVLR